MQHRHRARDVVHAGQQEAHQHRRNDSDGGSHQHDQRVVDGKKARDRVHQPQLDEAHDGQAGADGRVDQRILYVRCIKKRGLAQQQRQQRRNGRPYQVKLADIDPGHSRHCRDC